MLYHLNALGEPENVDYPKDPEFFENSGPRNVIQTWAADEFDKTEDPRFGVDGKRIVRQRDFDDSRPRESRCNGKFNFACAKCIAASQAVEDNACEVSKS